MELGYPWTAAIGDVALVGCDDAGVGITDVVPVEDVAERSHEARRTIPSATLRVINRGRMLTLESRTRRFP